MRAPEPQPREKALPWLYACQQHTFTQDVTYPWLGHFSCPLPIAHSLTVWATSENRPEAVSLEHSYVSCVSHYQHWASTHHRTWRGSEGQQRRAYDCSLCNSANVGTQAPRSVTSPVNGTAGQVYLSVVCALPTAQPEGAGTPVPPCFTFLYSSCPSTVMFRPNGSPVSIVHHQSTKSGFSVPLIPFICS